jgi:methylated-DNA-[protein]-cysteine S-methyltransferase
MATEVQSAPRARYRLFETPLGPCGIAWTEHGVARLQLPEGDRGATERRLRKAATHSASAPAEVEQVIADVHWYLSGRRTDFSAAALDLANTGAFEQKVYALVRSIGWGQTASYGEIAAQMGTPHAARAVGQALARNPIPIIIPCHRILAKGHRIGGFSAYGGRLTKERLLGLEGVQLEAAPPLLPGFV